MATLENCGEASRFACLKIEDDEEPDKSFSGKNSQFTTVTTKKKAAKQKKKKVPNPVINQQNQSLVGQCPVIGLHPVAQNNTIPLAAQKDYGKKSGTQAKKGSEEWKVWQDRDKDFVAEAYQHDLQEAIAQSRKEFTTHKKMNKLRDEQEDLMKRIEEGEVTTDAGVSKKKKKKQKQQHVDKKVMTLEEFQQLPRDVANQNSPSPPSSIPSSPVKYFDPLDVTSHLTAAGKSFVNVDETIDQAAILEEEREALESAESQAVLMMEKERRQAELKESLKADSNLRNQFKHELGRRDTKIKSLETEVEELKTECDEVKKRNKYLCRIMMQGEMKDKAELLKELEELQQVKNEMTGDLTELHGQLEKEKSENHKLKEEIKRLQKK